jgi:hypothetical protein
MQVAEERVPHVDGAVPALDETMVGAGAVVHHDEVVADFEKVAGTLPFERGRRRSGPQQRDFNGLPLKTLGRCACAEGRSNS